MSLNKGQVWTTDFIVGFLIFAVGAILVSRMIMNSMADNNFLEVKRESEKISEYLMSEGVPENWTNNTIVRAGLLSYDRLDTRKLSEFQNLTYEDSQLYLGTAYDYQLLFRKENETLNISRCGYGAASMNNCTLNLSEVEYDDLVKTTRLVLYNHSIIKMVVYVWG